MVVRKCAEEPKDRIDVLRFYRLIVLHARSHLIENIERTQDDFVFLAQMVGALHNALLRKFLNASANPRSPENRSAAAANEVW